MQDMYEREFPGQGLEYYRGLNPEAISVLNQEGIVYLGEQGERKSTVQRLASHFGIAERVITFATAASLAFAGCNLPGQNDAEGQINSTPSPTAPVPIEIERSPIPKPTYAQPTETPSPPVPPQTTRSPIPAFTPTATAEPTRTPTPIPPPENAATVTPSPTSTPEATPTEFPTPVIIERDPAVEMIPMTEIEVDPALADREQTPIFDVIPNIDAYPNSEAQNRLDAAIINALARIDVTGDLVRNGGRAELENMLMNARMPADPNFDEFKNQLTNNEKVMIPIFAYPGDSAEGRPPLTEFNAKEGIEFVISNELQFVELQWDSSLNKQAAGYSLFVNPDNGALTVKIYFTDTTYPPYESYTPQDMLNGGYSILMLRVIDSMALTLGGYREDNQTAAYDSEYVAGGYQSKRNNNGGSAFPELSEAFGGPEQDPTYGWRLGPYLIKVVS